MKRRQFLTQTAALGALSVLPWSCLVNKGKRYKLGYQLYSIRDEMAKDPVPTLKALKAMGYEDFETYGYDTDNDTYYGIKSKEFNLILNDLGLTVSSGHFGFHPLLESSEDELKRFVDRCIIGASAVNSAYITWPWLAPEQRNLNGFKTLVQQLNRIGEQVNKAGLGFAYHNHGFDFDDLVGTTGYDIILKDTDPELVKLQMDMYWVMHAGKTTPKKLIKEHPGRFVMWHVKDMHKVSRDYTELGNGSIDYMNILPDPKESGLEYFYIEQGGNFTSSSMESAKVSAEYFKSHLQDLI